MVYSIIPSNVFRTRIHLLFACLFTLISLPVLSQDTLSSNDKIKLIQFRRQPSISFRYGFAEYKHNDLQQSFAKPKLYELQLGGFNIDTVRETEKIFHFNHEYLSIINVSADIGGASTSGELNSDLWRFGFTSENGYGYFLNSPAITPSIILTHSDGIQWSKLNMKDAAVLSADSALLSLYDDTFRFGMNTEAGLKFGITRNLYVDAGFERSVLFRRHLVWKWFASVALESVAQSVVDYIVERIMYSSPTAVPVVRFLLKNGLSYGYYELMKSKMNYPFSSEPPLRSDSFKFGVTFVF